MKELIKRILGDQVVSFALIFSFLQRRERIFLAGMLVAQILLGILDLLGILAMGLVGSITVYAIQSRSLPENIANLIDNIGLSTLSLQNQVSILASVSGLVLVSRSVLSSLIARQVIRFLSNRAASISSRLVNQFFSKDILFINNTSTQLRIHSLTTGVNNITVGVIGSTVNTLADLFILVILSGGLFVVDSSMAIVTIIYFALLSYVLYRLISKQSRTLARLETENAIKINDLLMKSIVAFREIYVRNLIKDTVQEFEVLRFRNAKTSSDSAFLSQISKYALEIGLVIGAILFSAFQFITKDAVAAISTLSVFLIASTRIAPATLRIQGAILSVKNALSASFTTLDVMRELSEESHSKAEISYLEENREIFEPKIEFENVSYKFSKNDSEILDSVSLKVNTGECVGIIGSSGVGKSTLLDLILGLYSPTKGEIKVSGLPPKKAISFFPTSISYVPQEVTLFPGTVRENIAIGYQTNHVNDEKIWKSLEKASLMDFVQHLPGCLDYIIGERGVNLSGGQKQRIGLARAFYSEPKLLLLDEATSALDAQTEKDILDTLLAVKNQITVVFVTHKLTTLNLFDRVYRIKDGKIKLESPNMIQK